MSCDVGVVTERLENGQSVGAESNGKLRTYSSLANLVSKFAVEDLPLGRTSALVPEFVVEGLVLG